MITTINTKNAPAAIGPYSQGKVVDGVLYASGQIPADAETGVIVGSTIAEQAERAIKNVAAILEEAGSDFEHVVKATCFLSDMSDFTEFNRVYEKYFISKPARSCVAVKELPKQVLVEVEVMAICK